MRKVDTRPTDEGWVEIDIGRRLWMIFHCNRRPGGRSDDGVERPSVVYGEQGSDMQLGRIDAFSVGGHFHVLPTRGDKPDPLVPRDGQTFFEAAMDFLREPKRFLELLRKAHRSDLAKAVSARSLRAAAQKIERLHRATAT